MYNQTDDTTQQETYKKVLSKNKKNLEGYVVVLQRRQDGVFLFCSNQYKNRYCKYVYSTIAEAEAVSAKWAQDECVRDGWYISPFVRSFAEPIKGTAAFDVYQVTVNN
jgi:hypothetical protein